MRSTSPLYWYAPRTAHTLRLTVHLQLLPVRQHPCRRPLLTTPQLYYKGVLITFSNAYVPPYTSRLPY